MTPPPQYTSEELLATMKDRLNLTDDQQAKVRPIIEEFCQKRMDIIGNYIGQAPRGGDCCLRCDLQRLGESTEKQLATILTEKQMREYKKIQDELQPKPPETDHKGWVVGEEWVAVGVVEVGEAGVAVCHRNVAQFKVPAK